MIYPTNNVRRKKNLMEKIGRLSLIISTIIIILVLLISIVVISFFTVHNLNRNAGATADQMSTVLAVPLYTVDDSQSLRIIEVLLSSDRVSGVYLESSATGVLVDKIPARVSPWIRRQRREIRYNNIYLGRLDIYFSDTAITDFVGHIFAIMLVIVGAIIGANFLVNRVIIQNRVRNIFDAIKRGIREITEGNYTYVLKDSGYDDMDSIINVLNDMSRNIRNKKEELVKVLAGLEDRVAERTRELKTALNEQTLLQDRLIESGKLSVLGQLSAGIAHELNTPLGAIQSSARLLTAFFSGTFTEIPQFIRSCNPSEIRLFDTLLEIGLEKNKTLGDHIPTRRVIHEINLEMEKAGIGKSGELADRLADIGIENYLERIIPLLNTKRDPDIIHIVEDAVIAHRMIAVINESSRKAGLVISALRSYLSPQTDVEETVIDVSSNIRQALTLIHNMLKYGIVVKTDFTTAHIQGSADKLSQVWINLIRNAAQAMEFNGELDISVKPSGENVRITITDSGPGIPEEIANRIFEPFFTTKKNGDGMGLGLDLSKKIIESHNGTIEVLSRPGRTEFVVLLPTVERT